MKTQYYTAASLDGFIAGPGDSLDWLFPLGDIADTSYPRFIADVGALAMGSATYAWMLRHVVGPEATQPGGWPYAMPTWVFSSRTLPGVPGADVRFARGDVRPVHRAMAEAANGKNVWLVGGGDLVGHLSHGQAGLTVPHRPDAQMRDMRTRHMPCSRLERVQRRHNAQRHDRISTGARAVHGARAGGAGDRGRAGGL